MLTVYINPDVIIDWFVRILKIWPHTKAILGILCCCNCTFTRSLLRLSLSNSCYASWSTVSYMVQLHEGQDEHQGRSSVQLQQQSSTENRIVVLSLKMHNHASDVVKRFNYSRKKTCIQFQKLDIPMPEAGQVLAALE